MRVPLLATSDQTSISRHVDDLVCVQSRKRGKFQCNILSFRRAVNDAFIIRAMNSHFSRDLGRVTKVRIWRNTYSQISLYIVPHCSIQEEIHELYPVQDGGGSKKYPTWPPFCIPIWAQGTVDPNHLKIIVSWHTKFQFLPKRHEKNNFVTSKLQK